MYYKLYNYTFLFVNLIIHNDNICHFEAYFTTKILYTITKINSILESFNCFGIPTYQYIHIILSQYYMTYIL